MPDKFDHPLSRRCRCQSEIGLIHNDLDSAGWSQLDLETPVDIDSIAKSLGPTITDARTGSFFTDLMPYWIESAPKESMSSTVGTAEQPLHTDGAHLCEPPRYIILFCMDPGEAPCPTHVWQIDIQQLERDWPSLLSDPNWIFDDRLNPPFYSPILQSVRNILKIRFDPCCMRPANHSGLRVTDALNELRKYTRRFAVQWNEGRAIIIDNWRCLHGRGAGSIDSPSRRLRRWYIGDWENGMVKRSSL